MPYHCLRLWGRLLQSLVSKAADRSSKVRAVTLLLSEIHKTRNVLCISATVYGCENVTVDLTKGSLCRVELLVGRLKIVRLIGRFKERADLRSYNLFNKFGSKTEVWHGAIVLKIWSTLTMLSVHVISSMCSENQCNGTNGHLEWLLTTPAHKPHVLKLSVWNVKDQVLWTKKGENRRYVVEKKRRKHRTRAKKRGKRRYTWKPEYCKVFCCPYQVPEDYMGLAFCVSKFQPKNFSAKCNHSLD